MDVQVYSHPGFASDLYVDGERLAGVEPAVGDVIEALAQTHEQGQQACAAALAFLSSLAEYRRDAEKQYGSFEIVSVDNAKFEALLAVLRAVASGGGG